MRESKRSGVPDNRALQSILPDRIIRLGSPRLKEEYAINDERLQKEIREYQEEENGPVD